MILKTLLSPAVTSGTAYSTAVQITLPRWTHWNSLGPFLPAPSGELVQNQHRKTFTSVQASSISASHSFGTPLCKDRLTKEREQRYVEVPEYQQHCAQQVRLSAAMRCNT